MNTIDPRELTFVERLRNESEELEMKIRKLRDFKHTDTFQKLDEDTRHLLGVQLAVMDSYIYVLKARLLKLTK